MSVSDPVAPLALTMGEPAGIGGELALRIWCNQRDSVSPFFIIDDPKRLSKIAHACNLDICIEQIYTTERALEIFDYALPVLPVEIPLETNVQSGLPDPANVRAVIGSIDQAVKLARGGLASAVVTNPIHKGVLKEANFPFISHTDYLAHISGKNNAAQMMIVVDGLRTVPVTVHLPLREVASHLSIDAIVQAGRAARTSLQDDFGIKIPCLAVAAFNPHSGEDGTLGREEIDIITPAANTLRNDGLKVIGPLPADTLFHAEARSQYDAVLCMYHDQALIPAKSLDFYGGVNLTIGLSFVRTSPDHGTAFDLVGTGAARTDSLIAALRLAANIAELRGVHDNGKPT